MQRITLAAPVTAFLVALGSAAPIAAQAPTARPAPTESGIYLSANAYLAGKLEQAIDTRTGSHVIDRHTLLNKGYVDVEHEGKRTRYNKKDIYGYRDAAGHDVRFAGKQEYTIAEAGPLYIYTAERLATESKRTKAVTDYYFSRTPSSPVLPLTLADVKRAVPDEHQFHHVLDMNFANGESLAAYDSAAKSFKINVLYRQGK